MMHSNTGLLRLTARREIPKLAVTLAEPVAIRGLLCRYLVTGPRSLVLLPDDTRAAINPQYARYP